MAESIDVDRLEETLKLFMEISGVYAHERAAIISMNSSLFVIFYSSNILMMFR